MGRARSRAQDHRGRDTDPQQVLLAFERAEIEEDERERRRSLTFLVIGGGPTGVEMAGAIAEVARQSLAADFPMIDPASARILLIAAGPRILAGLPPDLSSYAERELTRMGVDVLTSRRVTQCHVRGIETDQGPIETEVLIWAAGVQASPAARWLEVEADRAGRIEVAADLSVSDRPSVYAIGDTAAVATPEGSVPALHRPPSNWARMLAGSSPHACQAFSRRRHSTTSTAAISRPSAGKWRS